MHNWINKLKQTTKYNEIVLESTTSKQKITTIISVPSSITLVVNYLPNKYLQKKWRRDDLSVGGDAWWE